LPDKYYIGMDIGGTKTAVLLVTEKAQFLDRQEFPTSKGKDGWRQTVYQLKDICKNFIARQKIEAIGISCGGPLDSQKGYILSPPNLPGWDDIPIVEIFLEAFEVPVYLQNDANAGALAEWIYGAGRGTKNMIFLTFGTGLGAGLILNGRLYSGTNDLAGETGHIRLAEAGPIGFHKPGSFEGFCSGPGFSQMMSSELLSLSDQSDRETVSIKYKDPGDITGKDVVEWAQKGDPLAMKVIEKSGSYLGKGLAILIDILNPELIVIGGMGVRLGELLLSPARKVIDEEAIPGAAKVCKIVPAALGEKIGDYAALCVCLEHTHNH
jgi:glucokinase